VLFERLINLDEFLAYTENQVISSREAVERNVVKYLFQSYKRNFVRSSNRNDSVLADCSTKVQDLILTNLSTAIKTPDLFIGQDLSQQLLDIVVRSLEDDEEVLTSFIPELVKAMMSDLDEAVVNFALLESFFRPTFAQCVKSLKNASLLSVEKWILPYLNIFVVDKSTAALLLKFSTPKPTAAGYEGAQFSESLLGALLCLSILPKSAHGPYEYYDDPTNISSIDLTTSTLWNHLKLLLDAMAQLFKCILLFGGQLRTDLLLWIGNCLHANSARGQMGHTISPLLNIRVAPDSFMINLANVLLRLSRPLLKPQLKVMSVDPTYTWVKDDEMDAANVHMKGIHKETCLLPLAEDERVIAASYNFVTELFFMTHKAIDLSYRVCIEKLIKMNRELSRLRSAYQDTAQQPGGQDLAENLLKMLKSQSQQFLSLKKIISEPTNDELLVNRMRDVDFFQAL
jgi:ubiquitin conjugation factor E4 A